MNWTCSCIGQLVTEWTGQILYKDIKHRRKKKKKKHILNDGILEQMPAKATGNNTTFDFDSIIVWNSESHNRNIPLSKNSNRKLMCPNSKVKEIY